MIRRGNLHPARDRQRSDGVGRRNDRAEDEPDRPGKSEEPMGRRGDCGCREEDAPDGKKRDRTQVEPELLPAHRHRGRIDQGRQNQHQDQVRRELHRRQPGNEGEPGAGDHEEDRWRKLQSPCHDRDCGNDDQEQDQNLKGLGHGRASPKPVSTE